jgi:hypothetical protein
MNRFSKIISKTLGTSSEVHEHTKRDQGVARNP